MNVNEFVELLLNSVQIGKMPRYPKQCEIISRHHYVDIVK